jgi:predicted nucleotidyltransferase
MGAVAEDVIAKVTDAIVKTSHPLKIILFGSAARGEAGASSDLDFLIIGDGSFDASRSRRRELGNIHRSLSDIKIPIDVLLYSKQEFDAWKDSINHVIARANREGKVVYERS